MMVIRFLLIILGFLRNLLYAHQVHSEADVGLLQHPRWSAL